MLKVNYRTIRRLIPARRKDSHKGDYGKVLLLCGSVGYTGAAALAAMGALRTGAGLVYLCVPESIYEIEAVKLTEAIVLPMPDKDGMLSITAKEKLMTLLPRMDAVLIGPGLGVSKDVSQLVQWVLQNYNGPIVLDADGINVMKEHKDVLRDRTSPTILTPHEGEYVRFSDLPCDDRIHAAVSLAQELGCVVLLKGHKTVITDGTSTYQNQTGNPGMAVGGSGDVLSGVITSLLGQGLNPVCAAACGAWLHGKVGDICKNKIGQYGMLPTDMLDVLPRILR